MKPTNKTSGQSASPATNDNLHSAIIIAGSEHDLALPFPLGYSNRVACRLSQFYTDDKDRLHCQIHNAYGTMAARIARKELLEVEREEWGVYEVNVVMIRSADGVCAEILTAKNLREDSQQDLSMLIPRALCDMPAKLDELRYQIQMVHNLRLRRLLSTIFGQQDVYEPFLKAYGGLDSYNYPCGLLVRTVAAGREAIRMGFQTQEEADVVLAAALLYDLGRIRAGRPTSESLRTIYGFVPHEATIDIVGYHLRERTPSNAALRELLITGCCDQYPSTSVRLGKDSALEKIDNLIRIPCQRKPLGRKGGDDYDQR